MSGGGLLLIAVAVPLLLAPLCLAPATRVIAVALAPWAALPALAAAAFVEPGTSLRLPWLLVGFAFGLDRIGYVFLLFTAIIGLLAGGSMRAELGGDPRRFRFAAFYLAGLAGCLGVALAQEIVTFYTFFALMTLAAYGFVIHRHTREAHYAGRVYIVLAVLGEGMLLAGLMLAAAAGGGALADAPLAVALAPQRDWIIALLLGGFGVKAGLLPLHVSLPLAYAAAPLSGAVLLAGAMIKAGLLGWLRLLPFGAAALPEWGGLLVCTGLAAMFYGVAVGLAQINLGAMLAYSSISQMGFMIIGLGLALLAPPLWPLALSAVLIYATHHALVKSSLFLGLAAVDSGVRRGWALAGAGLLAAMLAGAPLTGGAIAKFHLKDVAHLAPAPWGTVVELLLPVGAFATALLMARFLFLLWRFPAKRRARRVGLIWLVALGASASLVWLVPGVDPAALARHWAAPAAWWEEGWPVLAAALAGFALARPRRGRPRSEPLIPPGDIVVPLQSMWRALERRRRAVATILHGAGPGVPRPAPWNAAAIFIGKSQALLQHWPVAGTLFLLLVVVMLLLLAA